MKETNKTTDTPIETEVVPDNQQALELAKPLTPAVQNEHKPTITATQAKVEAIADLTHSAYQKASTLQITKEESDALQADFPDEAFKPGAGGNENLIYIEHAFLRDRFTQVFGMGQWAIIVRRTWSEQFVIPARRDRPQVDGERVYVEAMLVIRGCFVGEAVGAMEYYPKNGSQNYSDACEGAKTAAFRRCAKEFSVGLQAWKKDWCQGWWDRKMKPGKRVHPPAAKPADGAPPPKVPPSIASCRKKFLSNLAEAKMSEDAWSFMVAIGWILDTEKLDQVPDRFVPRTPEHFKSFMEKLKNFVENGVFEKPYPALDDSVGTTDVPRGTSETDDAAEAPPEEDEPWRSFPMPFGKDAGVLLGDMDKKKLFGWWANYTVETEYNGRPKKPETIAKDTTFREMLDQAGAHYKFTKKD